MSLGEATVWNLLRMEPLKVHHFRRQVPFGPYYADFASHAAKLIIEVDGSQHTMDEAIVRDAKRDAFLNAQGYRVLRVTTLDVLQNADGVFASIVQAAHPTYQASPGPPSP